VFVAEDLTFDDDLPVLMTDKDAVRCKWLACNNCWVVRVAAIPDENFVAPLAARL
jgi:tetraacyldisaccharide 4'-kinase